MSKFAGESLLYNASMPDPLAWLDDALADLDGRGLRRSLSARNGPQRGDRIQIGGRTLVNFGSNDYLGLAADPRIAEAAKKAIDEYGWGSGASPLVTGRSELHAELERKLAEFEGTEAALLFPSGYAANVGTICALVGKGDAIYSDELNHASIIDGCRLSGAVVHIYANPARTQLARSASEGNGPGTNDRRGLPSLARRASDGAASRELDDLERQLASGSTFRRRLIVTDTLFSMHGNCANLGRLIEVARQYDATLLVDEAHATGVLGNTGRGLCEEQRVESQVPIRIGTLSKALGSHGGFVAGSRRLVEWLANRARPYVFSTAAPSAIAAAGLAALRIVEREPGRRNRLQAALSRLREKLVEAALPTERPQSHIVPIILGDPERTMAAAAELRRRGFFVPGIRPPSVPEGQSLLRLSLTCLHTDEQIDALVAALGEVAG